MASKVYYIDSCKVLELKSSLIYLESEKLKNSETLKESKPPMKEDKEEKPKKVKLSSAENKKEAKSSTSKSECKIDEDCADRM